MGSGLADANRSARSAIMRAVKSTGTGPERLVRSILWRLAPGYRLNRRDLPGKPDIAYGARKLALFVHGCFWHGHQCKRGARAPKSNAGYWRDKIARNRLRDAAAAARLIDMGWRVVAIFECEMKDRAALKTRMRRALDESGANTASRQMEI